MSHSRAELKRDCVGKERVVCAQWQYIATIVRRQNVEFYYTETQMSKKLSEYNIDELLLMQRAKFLKLLHKTIAELRLLLDPDGEIADESGANANNKK